MVKPPGENRKRGKEREGKRVQRESRASIYMKGSVGSTFLRSIYGGFGVEHGLRWQSIMLRPFWEQSGRRGRKQLLHERSDVRNEVRGFRSVYERRRDLTCESACLRVQVYTCAPVCARARLCVRGYRLTGRGSWRNREDIKEIGRGRAART